MQLKYQCPNCGTPLNYQGLCWRCTSEANRQKALAWTPTQIAENQQTVLENIQALEEMGTQKSQFFGICSLVIMLLHQKSRERHWRRKSITPVRDTLMEGTEH